VHKSKQIGDITGKFHGKIQLEGCEFDQAGIRDTSFRGAEQPNPMLANV
jgi:hypothetical protein